MKNGILLVLIGFLVQSLDVIAKVDSYSINVCSDIIAYALIIAGIYPFIKEQNLLFKKCFKLSIILLIIEIFNVIMRNINFGSSQFTVNALFMAFTSLFFMQLVYNYTEAMILQARFLKIEIKPSPYRNAYSVFCVVIIGNFLINAFYSIFAPYASIILTICAFYYCATMMNLKKTLYP